MAKSVTSPDISILDFSVLLDMSLAQPTFSVTNQSTVTVAANLQWVFEILSPAGTVIHTADFNTPDIDGVPFTVFNFTDQIPLPFGLLEFSKINEYSVKISVKDSNGDIFFLTKAKSICKPNGNNDKNNFGTADIQIQSKCSMGVLYITDQTDLMYKGITGTKISSNGTLTYPKNSDGTQPN